MKRVLACVLCAVLLLTSVPVGAAADGGCDCGITPVVYVVGFGRELYSHPESAAPGAVFPPDSALVRKAVPTLLKAVSAAALDDDDAFAAYVVDALDILLGQMACDPNGDPAHPVGIIEEPMIDNHQITHIRIGPVEQDSEPSGAFVFAQDWRLSPLDNAKRLKGYIDEVKALTGHDSVSLVAHSQGNCILASYLYLYGNGGIERLTFLSPAFQGISLIGALLTGEYAVAEQGDELIAFMDSLLGRDISGELLTALVRTLKTLGVVDPLLSRVQSLLDSKFDEIYAESLTVLFGQMPGVWGFVPDEYYDAAKTRTLGGDKKYASLEKKIDEYHENVQNKLTDLLNEAIAAGVPIAIVAGYDISTIPVNHNVPGQSDMLIDTRYMSIGATTAPYGKTLGDSYRQAVDDGHDHLSADGILDASTAAFPEYTWFLKGVSHNEFPKGYRDFTDYLIHADGFVTVEQDARYPQFITCKKDGSLTPVTGEETGHVLLRLLRSILYFIRELLAIFR